MLLGKYVVNDFFLWLKRKRMVVAIIWYALTIMVLAMVGKTLFKVRTVKAVTCCMGQGDCGGAGHCLVNYSCDSSSKPHMCC